MADNIAKELRDKVAKDKQFNSNSLVFKYTTDKILDKYRFTRTKNGFTIYDVINSGLKNPDSGVGVYAGDEESYSTFSDLFDKIIEDYHGHKPGDKHKSDMNPANLKIGGDLDPERKYIKSTRIRVGRNVQGFALNPLVESYGRAEIEKQIITALSDFEGDLKGHYYQLGKLTDEERNKLIENHFLFKKGDRFLEHAGCNRDWPRNRGIFHNDDKTFLVWVNEEDQLRIISMQEGGDIRQVFERLSRAVAKMENTMKFSYNDHLGVISSCPTNLGTAMRASVHIALPNLAKDKEALEAICDKLELQARGIHGEHSETTGGVFDISNKRRLGLTEVQCVQTMYNGVKKLIELEEMGADHAPLAARREAETGGGCQCTVM